MPESLRTIPLFSCKRAIYLKLYILGSHDLVSTAVTFIYTFLCFCVDICLKNLLAIYIPTSVFSHTTKEQFSRHQLGVLNSTQFWHHLSGESIRFHRLKAQSHSKAHPFPFRCQFQGQVVTGPSDQLATNCRLQWSLPTQDANHKYRLLPVLLNNWL